MNRQSCGGRGLFVLLAAAVIGSPRSLAAQPSAAASRQIPLGEAFSVRSAILNEDRELLVALPEGYQRTTVSYPVVYVLDGSSNLLHATASVRFLANARNRIPEMIVVAIPNRNRNRDLTPGPGAATFERVLGEEIIPWVERTFRAAPERILVGHSLSASFAVHALLNRPELFDAYVAASAPVWRYDGLDADLRNGLTRAAKAGAALHLSVGERENDQLRGGVQRLAAMLDAADRATVPAWSFTDMKDEDHSSTPQRSLYNALEARYTEWRFPFFDDSTELDRVGGLKALEAHYERFSARFGFNAPPPEDRLGQVGNIYRTAGRRDEVVALADKYASPYPRFAEGLVNQVGYEHLQRGETARAIETFKRNAERFPTSPNTYDSLGDAYCRAGDRAAGQRSYADAARVAAARTPPPPRLAWYQGKAAKGCDP